MSSTTPILSFALATPALLVTAAASLATSGRAQDAATTLHALASRADAIVVAHTGGASLGNGTHQHLSFTTQLTLKGAAPGSFSLSEPGGQCCGRALHGMTYGSYILFLALDGQQVQLSVSNARSVAIATPELTEHIRNLLDADATSIIAELTQSLSSASPRVRTDAALALPRLSHLDASTGADRSRIVAALARSVARQDDMLSGLLLTAARLRLSAALEHVVTPYLAGDMTRSERLALVVIPQLGAKQAATKIRQTMPSDTAGRSRATRLLCALPAADAESGLKAIFQAADDDASVDACVALLSHGISNDWVEENGNPRVVQSARRAALRPPTFRSIRPGVRDR